MLVYKQHTAHAQKSTVRVTDIPVQNQTPKLALLRQTSDYLAPREDHSALLFVDVEVKLAFVQTPPVILSLTKMFPKRPTYTETVHLKQHLYNPDHPSLKNVHRAIKALIRTASGWEAAKASRDAGHTTTRQGDEGQKLWVNFPDGITD